MTQATPWFDGFETRRFELPDASIFARVGGRRELVIPPRLAYGENGRHALSGKTLIFVIDLLAVTS